MQIPCGTIRYDTRYRGIVHYGTGYKDIFVNWLYLDIINTFSCNLT